MGMFDKDKEIGLQMKDWIGADEPFILWDVTGPVQVQLEGGVARQTTLKVSKVGDPNDRYEVNTLSAPIADKAPEADASEFPAVVMWTTVEPTKASFGQRPTVLRFLKPYTGAPAPASGHLERDSASPEPAPEDTPAT